MSRDDRKGEGEGAGGGAAKAGDEVVIVGREGEEADVREGMVWPAGEVEIIV